MKHQRTRYGYVLRLDRGEEIVASVRGFAAREGVRCGLLSGLGAAGPVELGYFVRDGGEYVRHRFEGEYEILALTGNLSELEGEAFPHLHILIGDREFGVHGGHLFLGVVTVTCELQIVNDPATLKRVKGPGGAFHPLEPSGGG